jgi:thiol-disulfide isomerase/thioredoxin
MRASSFRSDARRPSGHSLRRLLPLAVAALCTTTPVQSHVGSQGSAGTPAIGPGVANEPGTQSRAAVVAGWDFTLPTLDGSRFVRLRDAADPVLVNFWGVDCPPCVAELPMLLNFARAQPGWTVLLIAADPPAAARGLAARLPQPLPPNVFLLRGATQARVLLREAGSRQGGLPHSVALRPGAVGACGAHAGMLTDPSLAQAASTCAAPSPEEKKPRAASS